MKAKFLSLNKRDFINGFIVAVITAVITFLTNELSANSVIDITLLKKVGLTVFIATLSYLLKNWMSNSEGKFATPEPKK